MLSLGLTGTAWTLELAVLFLLVVLLPVVRRRFEADAPSVGARYAAALRLTLFAGAVVHAVAALAFLSWRASPSTGAWDILPLPATTVFEQIIRSEWFPWWDLFTAPIEDRAPRTLLTGVVCATLGALMVLVSSGDAADAEVVEYHGRAAPWFRRAGWPLAVVGALGSLVGLAYLALNGTAADPMMPASAWWTGWILLCLLIALLLASKLDVPAEQPAEPKPQVEAGLQRAPWERFLRQQGFSLLRAPDMSGVSDPVVADGERLGDRWRLAREVPRSDADHYLLPAGVPSRAAWAHQARFLAALREVAAQPEARAVLMHSGHSSGRSTAVFEAALEARLARGGTSLLVYPDRKASHVAHAALQEQIRQAGSRIPQVPNVIVLGESGFLRPAIVIAAADDLAAHLLARASISSVRDFLRNLRLLVLEDIESLSGARATNVALVLRRLNRVLARENSTPAVAMTCGANPAEAAGVQEFAQWLGAPRRLLESSIRDDAPLKHAHLYLFEEGPRLPDAQGVDALPGYQQLAWASASWGAPVHVADAFALTEPDRHEPAWTVELARHAGTKRPITPPVWSVPRAYVLVREIGARGLLSATESILHGATDLPSFEGHRLLSDESLVVLAPSLNDRPLVRWLLQRWIAASVDARGLSHGVWQNLLLPLGSRLVAGSPGRALLRRHIIAALAECPGSEGDLASLVALPESFRASNGKLGEEIVAEIVRELAEQQAIRRQTTRRLPPGAIAPTFEREWSLVVPLVVGTPLDAVTDDVVRIVAREERGGLRGVRAVDAAHVLRAAYPGALFHVDGVRYRILVEHFLAGWARVTASGPAEPVLRVTDPEDRWIECEATDIHACTEPDTERTYAGWTPSRASQASHHLGGLTFRYWRAECAMTERHAGYWELRDDGSGRTVRMSYHAWSGDPVERTTHTQVLVVEFPRTMREAGRVTLRRAAAAALRVLVDVPATDLIVDVLPHVRDTGTDATTCLLIADPTAGGAGLLDAFGASPFRMLDNLFTLLLLWLEDVAKLPQDWQHIGYACARQEETVSVTPDAAEVAALLRDLFGPAAPVVPNIAPAPEAPAPPDEPPVAGEADAFFAGTSAQDADPDRGKENP